ncbi:hypothetical protein GCM10011611_46220 [Aliidongia dinghuensis]|uniref:Protein kinase domain-containing protein n=1 Tax=Aliidongia dinghuensis TaxID=1867774 RepID=A0A8J3E5E3_9PROT|nr:serine/threonine-protein kinase [Aliidongia dinghuensis]GGF34728.1 hypothetical protein GCM10011611_46220 [Aliidongia dinghuensis]
MDDQVPASLGRFQIEGLLGKGAMGVVYKAHDPHIERTVAIKLIRADLLDGDSRERYLARFRNEARVAGRCVHPNIIGLYDFAFHEGNPYLVLEYVDGMDLGRAFPRGTPVAEGTVVQIALQVLDALGYAHGFGIIHRDVKPANILLAAAAGQLKVTDFGISRFEFDSTQSAVLIGTPSYMSPEQCRGASLDQRCDLFSLGCILYELACGQRAFAGASFAETLYRLTHEPHQPPQTVNPDLSQGLADVIDRALAKRPEDRFQTATDMAAALRQLDEGVVPAPGNGAAGPADEPTTLILPSDLSPLSGSRPATGSMPKSLSGASFNTLERQLASHMGPMAGYHLRRVLREAQSTEEFHRLMGELAPEGTPQHALIREALQSARAPDDAPAAEEQLTEPEAAEPEKAEPKSVTEPAAPATEEITDEFAAAVTRALLHVMGPIAPRLVTRARVRAANRDELKARCAEMIENPAERAEFLALLDRSLLT